MTSVAEAVELSGAVVGGVLAWWYGEERGHAVLGSAFDPSLTPSPIPESHTRRRLSSHHNHRAQAQAQAREAPAKASFSLNFCSRPLLIRR